MLKLPPNNFQTLKGLIFLKIYLHAHLIEQNMLKKFLVHDHLVNCAKSINTPKTNHVMNEM